MEALSKILISSNASVQSEGQWTGRCPSHNDTRYSLSIGRTPDKILLKCHAGCTFNDIVDGFELEAKDLFFDNSATLSSKNFNPYQNIKETYDYTDYLGNLKYQVVRYLNKDFRQRQPDPQDSSKWTWKIKGLENYFIYNIQNVKKQIDANEWVIFVEGEKDADNLNKLGLVSTTVAGGAKSNMGTTDLKKWKNYSEQLLGANLAIIPDNDDIGKAYSNNIIGLLKDKCKRLKLIELPGLYNKEDVSDWLAKGNSDNDLLSLIEETELIGEFKDEPWIEYTKNGSPKVNVSKAADYLINQFNGNIIYVEENFYFYDNGVWKEKLPSSISIKIKYILDHHSTSRLITDILNLIKIELEHKYADVKFNDHKNLLNLINGVLDIKENKLIPHDREFYFTLKHPVNYNPDSKCRRWDQFLVELEFDTETIKHLQEWAGYVFYPETRIQKCLYLQGSGRNGKSVFLEVLSKVWGNVTNMELSDLFDKFSISNLKGALANVCTDADSTNVLNPKFKSIVAGESVMADRKFKKPIIFEPFAKIIFSANDSIPTKDRSYGFFRRFDILKFDKKISDEAMDVNLKYHLIEKELDGIFLWAYNGLRRLISNNWEMTYSEKFKADTDQYIYESQPINFFIEDCCEIITDDYCLKDELMEEYNSWCISNNFAKMSKKSLTMELHKFGIVTARKEIGSFRKQVYLGVKLIKNRFNV